MNTKKLYIRADIFGIEFVTNCKDSISFIKNNIEEFIRLTINFNITNTKIIVDIKFIYTDTNNFNICFSESKKEFLLECPWHKINESTLLPMMFRYMVEWLRQKSGEIKVHASAIGKNGKTALFIAPSEGGKTTTAIAMCQKYGCFLKANDAAVIKNIDDLPFLFRGDTVFKVRYNAIESYSKKFFEEKINDTNGTNTPWFNKIKIIPEDIGIYSGNNISQINYLFFVKLDPLVFGCSVKKYNDDLFERKEYWFKSKMQIFQNIGGTIRGADLIPMGNYGELLPIEIPSLDTNELYLKRIELVNLLFNRCEAYQLRGQLEPMTEFINKILL